MNEKESHGFDPCSSCDTTDKYYKPELGQLTENFLWCPFVLPLFFFPQDPMQHCTGISKKFPPQLAALHLVVSTNIY